MTDNYQSKLRTSAVFAKRSRGNSLQKYGVDGEKFLNAVKNGNWDDAKMIYENKPNIVNATCQYSGKSPLHIAAIAGKADVVEQLVKYMNVKDLEIKGSIDGFTALADATMNDNISIAKCMVEKNRGIVSIATKTEMIPVVLAVAYRNKQMASYLYNVTPKEDLSPEKGANGARLLTYAVRMQHYDIAFRLLKRFPRLAFTSDHRGRSPIFELAWASSAFFGGCQLRFWQRWIYNYKCIHIQEDDQANNETAIDFPNKQDRQLNKITCSGVYRELRLVASKLLQLLGIEQIYEMKSVHRYSSELLKRMCQAINDLDDKKEDSRDKHLEAIPEADDKREDLPGANGKMEDSSDPPLFKVIGKALGEAANGGNVKLLKNLLQMVLDVLPEADDKSEPLEVIGKALRDTANRGNVKLLKNLLQIVLDVILEADDKIKPLEVIFTALGEVAAKVEAILKGHCEKEDSCDPQLLKVVGKELGKAASKGNLKLFKNLLQMVPDVVTEVDDKSEPLEVIRKALWEAAARGNVEVFKSLLQMVPEFIWLNNENGETIFMHAIKFRQPKIFSLIHGFASKKAMATETDNYGNNMLHMAGLLAPSNQLNTIQGAALQMQRELQWFKEVEKIISHDRVEKKNNNLLTPRELFTKEHAKLMKAAEEWMKSTASSCTLVGALIVTVMFAVAFTVPGGNDQSSGFPIFLGKKLFNIFIILDAISLFSSIASVLMFLGILTSRYAEDDFLLWLPTKMMIGLFTLLLSLATMTTAFSMALLIMFRKEQWVKHSVIVLACLPTLLFIWMQFPLLFDMFISTYGRSIFYRKVECWLIS